MQAERKKKKISKMKELRCPTCKKYLGSYDENEGLKNAAYYCDKCKDICIFTIPKK